MQLPLGQLALVGLGALAILNPDKLFDTLQKGGQLAQLLGQRPASSDRSSQQPIVIHQVTNPSTSRTWTGCVIQLALGAGFCWGSYMVLVNVLPEAAKGMLPVSTTVFNRAVTSLGTAVINLKDNLTEQILGLVTKQDDLSDQQEKTHEEVLNVKDNVAEVKGDLGQVQESLDVCRLSLSESERRTSYIARGVQLLTRGVSTILSQDDDLLYELLQFNSAGEEFNALATPIQQRRPQQTLIPIDTGDKMEGSPLRSKALKGGKEVPKTPLQYSEGSLEEVRELLNTMRFVKAN